MTKQVRITWQELVDGRWVDRQVDGGSRVGVSDAAKARIIEYLGGPGRPPYRDLNFHGGE